MDGLGLSPDALAALKNVLGASADDDGSDLAGLAMLARQRRELEESSSEEEGGGGEEGYTPVDHAAYFRELYPDRYEETACTASTDGPRVAILSMEDEYVQKLLVEAFAKYPNWSVRTTVPDGSGTGEDYDLHWGEYEHIEWFAPRVSTGKVIASCYYTRKGLIRKALLAHIIEKWGTKYAERQPLMPKSFVLTMDPDEGVERRYAAFGQLVSATGFPGFTAQDPVWILKASITNQALGITLVDSDAALAKAVCEADEMQLAGSFVLQRYVPPLLLDKRKFHLRVFMVLNGDLTAHVSQDFLAISSLVDYSGAPIQQTRAHLTNISHQEVLSEADQVKCMRLFDETAQDFVSSGHCADAAAAKARIEAVKLRVNDMCAELVEAVSSELTFQARANCFEIFGLDFMLDPEWNVWLLEANAEPDLSKAGDRLQGVIDGMLRKTLALVVAGGEEEGKRSLAKVYERIRH